jgi:hypothetical protein
MHKVHRDQDFLVKLQLDIFHVMFEFVFLLLSNQDQQHQMMMNIIHLKHNEHL